MKNSISFILLTLTIVMCSSEGKIETLENDSLVLKVFTPDETESLKSILKYFDAFILEHTNSELSIDEAYKDYFTVVDKNEDMSEIFEDLGFQHSIKTQKLIRYLEERGVFKNIWKYRNEIRFYDGKKEKVVALDYSMRGKFIKLLKLYAQENSLIKECVEFIVGDEGNSPAAVSIFVKQFYKNVDLTRELNRLILAVAYITETSK